jgi:outer membrane protein assembly factor BamB
MHPIRLVVFLAWAFLAAAVQPVAAQLKAAPGDWPAWRGPDRTGLSKETGLLKEWPKEGPKLLWKADGLGTGYSTPSVAGGRIYLMGTKGRKERLIALDAKDGKEIWTTEVGALAGQRAAPRSTPTVDGDRVYVMSSDGKLVCAETAKGKVKWRKDLKANFGGRTGTWAYAESPLIDGDVLVCTPGGDNATLVALNKKTGDLIWKAPVKGLVAKPGRRGRASPYSTAGYSSVIVAEVGGVRQYIQFLGGGVVGIAAKDGKLLWHYDNPSSGSANCSTPIFHAGQVFAASAYRNGGGAAKITRNGDKFTARQEYFVKAMQNHHGGMVLVGDYIYGTAVNSLLCVNFKTGKIAWNEESVGKGSVAYADGHLYVRGEHGEVALVEANPKEYKEKSRFDQPDRSRQMAWPYPVIAGGKLYLRDWDILLCYDVKAR